MSNTCVSNYNVITIGFKKEIILLPVVALSNQVNDEFSKDDPLSGSVENNTEFTRKLQQ